MDWARFTANAFTGLIGIILVTTAAAESFFHGNTDPAILTLATAVVATYFTSSAVKQVNGSKVDALTQSVNGLHTRLDTAGIGPAKDGTTGSH